MNWIVNNWYSYLGFMMGIGVGVSIGSILQAVAWIKGPTRFIKVMAMIGLMSLVYAGLGLYGWYSGSLMQSETFRLSGYIYRDDCEKEKSNKLSQFQHMLKIGRK